MVKSPMEYFASQAFDAPDETADDALAQLTESERLFAQKYMGLGEVAESDSGRAQASASLAPPMPARIDVQPVALSGRQPQTQGDGMLPKVDGTAGSGRGTPEATAPATKAGTANDIPRLRRRKEHPAPDPQPVVGTGVQVVVFLVEGKSFALPTLSIQEVIRSQPPTYLPMAPDFVSGVINLRGHITPLVRLKNLLGLKAQSNELERFTIICKYRDMQFGVLIDQLQNMHSVMQKDLNWAADTSIGAGADFVTAVFESPDKLVPIISIERLADKILGTPI